jgi:hypothetical protein
MENRRRGLYTRLSASKEMSGNKYITMKQEQDLGFF